MSKRVTIYEIANDLNLSPGTISKVINNTGSVSEKTRKQVLEYIDEVGYVPSASARILKSKRTYIIGVIFSEDLNIGLEHPFFSSILQHFKNYAEDRGYELNFIVRKLGKNKMSYYEWCLNKRVDGVYIVVGNYQDNEILEVVNSNIPCVSNDFIIKNLHTVISDNRSGVELVLDYIEKKLKLKKIAMISGPKTSKAFKERTEVFEENYKKYNLEKTSAIYADGFGFTSGYNATLKILENKVKPEIIFCCSDDLALGVLKALNDKNINVPNDIQVIGYDDISMAKHFTPPLTTIRQDRKRLGEKAAHDLIENIENMESNKEEIIRIPVELVVRETTLEK
ncbi:LacI family DNA-binding transcriptional regulator [Haploplasma modicum]|uniref:LacI family DNA-binding transcriptional regulator n=1 Tax=Haploplasma modicum TaxID=2150 RepID=UPI00214C0F22|nr:LacI family DNA-binding transcriptional regulator [Haploplasma modicum]MCR1808792.1 LacI family transcriptional regulator [Haploplasma modicum]